MLGMDSDPTTSGIDDVQTAGGKMMLQEFGVRGSWEWRLMFDDGRTGTGPDQNGGVDRKLGLCVLYNADGTWTIGTGPTIAQGSIDNTDACAGVDEYVNLIRVTGGEEGAVFTHVARFKMPFTYTLIPLF